MVLAMCTRRIPLVSTVFNTERHTDIDCIENVSFIHFPDVGNLTPLEKICWNIFLSQTQRGEDTADRLKVLKEINQVVKAIYPDAILTIFGSCQNGFGFVDSDLDICMTFHSNANGKNLNIEAIIRELENILWQSGLFNRVMSLTRTRVPIIKLRHLATGVESDLSLYNLLGCRNSNLLATYCQIDIRVRILGYLVKLIAKQWGIKGASQGLLSSYAYSLMVIHYLQQIEPPVVPVLQEIADDGVDRRQYVVNGMDTWFFVNIQDLPRVWPKHGTNRQSPSTLWLGFLHFYANLFDFDRQVVTIRQSKPLYRYEKDGWSQHPITIEDPFSLAYNVGSALSARKLCLIRTVFREALILFLTPVKSFPNLISLKDDLFNPIHILVPSDQIAGMKMKCRFLGKGLNNTLNPPNDEMISFPSNRNLTQLIYDTRNLPPHEEDPDDLMVLFSFVGFILILLFFFCLSVHP